MLCVHVLLEFSHCAVTNYEEKMERVLVRATLDELSGRGRFHTDSILFRRDCADVESQDAVFEQAIV